MALWVESELWPNLVLATQARGIPMMLVNGRLSARSYRRWRRWPGLIRPMLGAFAECLAQDAEQAARLRMLGAREVAAVGDLKASGKALPVDLAQLRRLQWEIGRRPLWLAASTHHGEEEIAAAAHRRLAAAHPGLLTIIAPRHPARGDMVAAMLAASGLRVARRSRGEPIAAADRDLPRRYDRRAWFVLPACRDCLYRRVDDAEGRSQPVRGGLTRLRHPARAGHEQLHRHGGGARRRRRGADRERRG